MGNHNDENRKLHKKLENLQGYLRKLNGNSDAAERNPDAHKWRRVVNVEIVDIRLNKKAKDQNQVTDAQNPQFKVEPMFPEVRREDITFSNKIELESVVTIRYYYVYENQSYDLQTKPKPRNWEITVLEDKDQMLKDIMSRCCADNICFPDQKSLIDYLMTVLDGERISAKVKQFMLMI